MTRKKTPLQILAFILSGQEPPDDARQVREVIRQYAKTRRQREVANYLQAAAENRLPNEQKLGGSLKHVLWRLRDVAGELYEPAAKEVLTYVLQNAGIKLKYVLPHVENLPTVAMFSKDLQEPVDWRKLSTSLQEVSVGGLRVAVNLTTRNLTNVAMREGYDVMVAQSQMGTVVKAAAGFRIKVENLPQSGGWKQPYQDLVIWQADTPAPSWEEIVQSLPQAIEGQRKKRRRRRRRR